MVLSVSVAKPELFSLAVPIEVLPERKFTVPVGIMPETLGVTVAVRVAELPEITGFGATEIAVVVAILGVVTVT